MLMISDNVVNYAYAKVAGYIEVFLELLFNVPEARGRYSMFHYECEALPGNIGATVKVSRFYTWNDNKTGCREKVLEEVREIYVPYAIIESIISTDPYNVYIEEDFWYWRQAPENIIQFAKDHSVLDLIRAVNGTAVFDNLWLEHLIDE